MASVVLSNRKSWPSQSAARVHFRNILDQYSDASVITDPDHHADLEALLERYDAVLLPFERKNTHGVERFERRRNFGSGYATPGFWLIRRDGTAPDFSYLSALRV